MGSWYLVNLTAWEKEKVSPLYWWMMLWETAVEMNEHDLLCTWHVLDALLKINYHMCVESPSLEQALKKKHKNWNRKFQTSFNSSDSIDPTKTHSTRTDNEAVSFHKTNECLFNEWTRVSSRNNIKDTLHYWNSETDLIVFQKEKPLGFQQQQQKKCCRTGNEMVPLWRTKQHLARRQNSYGNWWFSTMRNRNKYVLTKPIS